MAHWAELDENNRVVRVVVGSNEEEDEGLAWIEENLGGRWIKTSFNARIRGKFAGAGDRYDEKLDEFVIVPAEPAIEIDGVEIIGSA